jgi:hypothetical protein
MYKVVTREVWKGKIFISEYYFENRQQLDKFIEICENQIQIEFVEVA